MYESVPSPQKLHKESFIRYRDGYPWKADRTPIVLSMIGKAIGRANYSQSRENCYQSR